MTLLDLDAFRRTPAIVRPAASAAATWAGLRLSRASDGLT